MSLIFKCQLCTGSTEKNFETPKYDEWLSHLLSEDHQMREAKKIFVRKSKHWGNDEEGEGIVTFIFTPKAFSARPFPLSDKELAEWISTYGFLLKFFHNTSNHSVVFTLRDLPTRLNQVKQIASVRELKGHEILIQLKSDCTPNEWDQFFKTDGRKFKDLKEHVVRERDSRNGPVSTSRRGDATAKAVSERVSNQELRPTKTEHIAKHQTSALSPICGPLAFLTIDCSTSSHAERADCASSSSPIQHNHNNDAAIPLGTRIITNTKRKYSNPSLNNRSTVVSGTEVSQGQSSRFHPPDRQNANQMAGTKNEARLAGCDTEKGDTESEKRQKKRKKRPKKKMSKRSEAHMNDDRSSVVQDQNMSLRQDQRRNYDERNSFQKDSKTENRNARSNDDRRMGDGSTTSYSSTLEFQSKEEEESCSSTRETGSPSFNFRGGFQPHTRVSESSSPSSRAAKTEKSALPSAAFVAKTSQTFYHHYQQQSINPPGHSAVQSQEYRRSAQSSQPSNYRDPLHPQLRQTGHQRGPRMHQPHNRNHSQHAPTDSPNHRFHQQTHGPRMYQPLPYNFPPASTHPSNHKFPQQGPSGHQLKGKGKPNRGPDKREFNRGAGAFNQGPDRYELSTKRGTPNRDPDRHGFIKEGGAFNNSQPLSPSLASLTDNQDSVVKKDMGNLVPPLLVPKPEEAIQIDTTIKASLSLVDKPEEEAVKGDPVEKCHEPVLSPSLALTDNQDAVVNKDIENVVPPLLAQKPEESIQIEATIKAPPLLVQKTEEAIQIDTTIKAPPSLVDKPEIAVKIDPEEKRQDQEPVLSPPLALTLTDNHDTVVKKDTGDVAPPFLVQKTEEAIQIDTTIKAPPSLVDKPEKAVRSDPEEKCQKPELSPSFESKPEVVVPSNAESIIQEKEVLSPSSIDTPVEVVQTDTEGNMEKPEASEN